MGAASAGGKKGNRASLCLTAQSLALFSILTTLRFFFLPFSVSAQTLLKPQLGRIRWLRRGKGFKRVSDCPLGDEAVKKKKKQDALSPHSFPVARLAPTQIPS